VIILAGLNIILAIGTIGRGVAIDGVSIGAINTGLVNTTGTDGIIGMTMIKSFATA
jgi:hypothetical protein